ncbi:hypothetical protein KH5H1_58350 [Corallococcus caeni]|nr:hypothetical protein KH5H1_58350 [Corallococcus sp. KH5-1]
MFEEPDHGHIALKRLVQPTGDADHGERRAAQVLEEVVVDADAPGTQLPGPEGGELFLQRIRGLHEPALASTGCDVWRGQGPTVQLAGGGEGQHGQRDERGRDHVLGEPLPQVFAQRGDVQHARDHVGHQPLVAGHVLAHEHGRVGEGGPVPEGGFDLGQLDAVAAHLHLAVDAAQELQAPIRAPAHAVARAVHALSGRGGEGVGDEALGGDVRAGEVAPREPVPANEQLPRHAHGHRPQRAVHHERPRVRQGRPDGDGLRPDVLGSLHAEAAGEDGGLRGAVAVDHRQAQRLHHAARVRRGQHVPAHDELPQPAQHLQLHVHHLREQARGQVERRDAVTADDLSQQLQVGGRLGREDDQPAAGQERAPQLQRRRVEGQGRHQQERLVRSEAGPAGTVQQPQHAPVLHGDALGTAGAAGSEVHVRQVPRGEGHVRSGGGLPLQAQLLHEDARHALRGRQRGAQRSGGDEQPGRRVLHHEGQPPRRIRGIQGHVGTTRLEDGQERDDQLHGALQAHGHQRIRPHALRAQHPGQRIRPGLQLRVRQPSVPELQRDGLRTPCGLEREAFRDVRLARVVHARGVPGREHLLALRGREPLQAAQGDVRSGDDGVQQRPQVAGQPLHGGTLEEVGAVLDDAAQAVRRLMQQQAQVEARGGVVHGHWSQREPRCLQLAGGRVLEREHRLHQRIAAQVARHLKLLHQLLEGQVLVLEGGERRGPHLGEQCAERVPRAHVPAKHQRVHEEADQPLQLRLAAARDGRAHQQLLLPRVPRQQHLPHREQRHVRRRAFRAAQRHQPVHQVRRQVHGKQCPLRGLERRTRLVRGQLQHQGRPGEVLLPPRHLPRQHLPLEPGALPHGEVRGLHGQRRQHGRPAGGERLVALGHLADQHAQRPAIGDDVVHAQEQQVFPRLQMQQPRAQDGAPAQVEGPRGLLH